MIECSKCNGNGLPEGCIGCGQVSYKTTVTRDVNEVAANYKIPTYYKVHTWDRDKIKSASSEHQNVVLQIVDKLVEQTYKGERINSSYAIMLPIGMGKKTAMFSIIQNYLNSGKTVAPVIDIASLAILENYFRLHDKTAIKQWRELIESDLVCVYGVDFAAKYHTMKLFLNLCSIRSLKDLPTLLFAESPLSELRPRDMQNLVNSTNNVIDSGSKLANPLILDGTK